VEHFDTSCDGLRPSKRFESQHRPYPAFDIAVVLLNQFVQILTFPDSNGFFIGFVGVELGQRCGVSTTFVDTDHLGFAVMANSFAKEAQCGCSGTVWRSAGSRWYDLLYRPPDTDNFIGCYF